MLKSIPLFHLFLFLVMILGCGPHPETTQQETSGRKTEPTDSLVTEVPIDRELAQEYVHNLRKEKVDTIIFYKRICIDCCEFYNVFWVSKGKYYLNKFYYDMADRNTHDVQINLTGNSLFKILSKNYRNLKHTAVKQNQHKLKDGTSSITMVDHYCSTELSIYTPQDSIISNSMADHDFDKYTAYHPTPNEKKETNDNYQANNQSEWNALLMAIERELSSMKETSGREKETLRGK